MSALCLHLVIVRIFWDWSGRPKNQGIFKKKIEIFFFQIDFFQIFEKEHFKWMFLLSLADPNFKGENVKDITGRPISKQVSPY